MYDIALSYLEAGLSVIPVEINTKKSYGKWQNYQKEKMTPDKAFSVFNKKTGIAIICGQVSGGLECIDFDNHFKNAQSIMHNFMLFAEVEEIIKKYELPIETSPSGGYHLFFRTNNPGTNKKLARKLNPKNRPETLIETRGEGGYVIVAPSRDYVMKKGDLTNIPLIEPIEREILLSAAQTFNEYIDDRDYANTSRQDFSDDERPGDEYNKSQEAIDEAKSILLSHGWTTRSGTYWTRPDKNARKGISATFGKIAPNVFYVFSSNAYPFEQEKAYLPFQILAILKYNLDFEKTASELRDRGFGKRSKYPALRLVYSKVRTETRKAQKLTPDEINAFAEDNDVPVNILSDEIKKAEKKYSEEWGFDKKPDIEKTEIYLKQNYKFRADIISRLPEMKMSDGPWEDLNIDTVYRNLQHEKIKYPLEKLKSLLRSDFVETYNPFSNYLNSLPQWDNIDHIGNLAKHINVLDQEYFNLMLEKTLVRNIACAIIPDYYNRIVFTLISEGQEIGKSFFIQWLNPFGSKYYTDEPLKDNKDSRFSLTENFIYNLEELDSLSKIDIGRLKATISTRGVKDRLPYGSHKIYFPRCCTFYGSTNRQEFLVDDRNTRWLCFYVQDINWDYSKKIDINKVWAQAWHLFNQSNYDYNLTIDEAKKRDEVNEMYRVIDFEASIITKYFEKTDTEWMSNAEILQMMIELTDNKIRLTTNPQKLSRVLGQLGFIRHKKDNRRGWLIKRKNESSFWTDNGDKEDLPF